MQGEKETGLTLGSFASSFDEPRLKGWVQRMVGLEEVSGPKFGTFRLRRGIRHGKSPKKFRRNRQGRPEAVGYLL
jgi:hypothetical protein